MHIKCWRLEHSTGIPCHWNPDDTFWRTWKANVDMHLLSLSTLPILASNVTTINQTVSCHYFAEHHFVKSNYCHWFEYWFMCTCRIPIIDHSHKWPSLLPTWVPKVESLLTTQFSFTLLPASACKMKSRCVVFYGLQCRTARHWFTTSNKWVFSKAAATRSLSANCLFTAKQTEKLKPFFHYFYLIIKRLGLEQEWH